MVATASVSLPSSSSAKIAPAPAPDPWAGPLTWTSTLLACVPVTGKPPKSPAANWSAFASGTKVRLRAVTVGLEKPDDVVIVGDEGTLLASRDRGKTFVRCKLAEKERLVAVFALSADDAWILGETRLIHVERLASVASSPIELAPHLDQGREATIFGSGANDVWFSNDRLRRTRDGGVTWSALGSTDLARAFSPGNGGPVQGSSGELWTVASFFTWRSVDGGVTWTDAGRSAWTEEALHLGVGSNDVCVAGQDSVTVACSSDHGATWSEEHLELTGTIDEWHRLFALASGGSGWAFASTSDGLWVRTGKPPWKRELPKEVDVRVGGARGKDAWAVGVSGLVLHRN